jgi:lysophospholipase
MGGHIVLRGLVQGDARPDAVVLIAPMLGVHAIGGQAIGERLAKIMGGVGDTSRPAWKTNEKPYTRESRQNLLTNDHDRYSDELWWKEQQPDLATGSPSWNWVIEAFKSMRELRANPRLKSMKVPVLMLIAEADGLVAPKLALQVAGKLPDARAVRFGKESAHEILREGDKVRNRAIGEIDLFLSARAQKQ